MEIFAPIQYSCYEHFVGLDIYIYCTVTLIVTEFFSIVADLKEMLKGLLCMIVITRNKAEAFYSVNIGTNLPNCWLSQFTRL